MSSKKSIKSAFESMMFVWGEPLSAKVAADVMDIDKNEAIDAFRELQKEYEETERGILIREVNGGFHFVTKMENHDYIQRLCTPVKEKRLSQSALEVLAIIAYKQPVTKGEIDAIRGIKSERVLDGLTKKGLIEEVGRSAAIGRPILYGTTDMFLRHFDFESIKELPEIDDIENSIHDPDANELDGLDQISIDLQEKQVQN